MLSDTIKEIRRKNYLNQAAFAKIIGVTQSAISQWENGLTRPNAEQLKAISTKFNISIDLLLSEEPLPSEKTDNAPKTEEAAILSRAVDRMPKNQREKALAVVRAMFTEYSDLFDGEEQDAP